MNRRNKILKGKANLEYADLREMNLSGMDLNKANLANANLTKACLRGTDLSYADLSGAILTDTDLIYANLRGADLHGADLIKANLNNARLISANLRQAVLVKAKLAAAQLLYADLEGADLEGAWLVWADLRRTNLYDANLRGVSLLGACLEDAELNSYTNLDAARLPAFQIPQHGELRVYKKVQGKIVLLKIPSWAKRTASLVGRKCRASAAVVLAIEGDYSKRSYYGYDEDPVPTILYKVGATIYPDSYDPDIRIQCSHGIHFFLTREEAENYV